MRSFVILIYVRMSPTVPCQASGIGLNNMPCILAYTYLCTYISIPKLKKDINNPMSLFLFVGKKLHRSTSREWQDLLKSSQGRGKMGLSQEEVPQMRVSLCCNCQQVVGSAGGFLQKILMTRQTLMGRGHP